MSRSCCRLRWRSARGPARPGDRLDVYSSGIRADDAAKLTIPAVDFERASCHRGRQGRQGSRGLRQATAAGTSRPTSSAAGRRSSSGSRSVAARCQRARPTSSRRMCCSCRPRRRGREVGIGASGILQMLTRRYKQGGGTLSSFGPHRLRHGMATNLAEQGVAEGNDHPLSRLKSPRAGLSSLETRAPPEVSTFILARPATVAAAPPDAVPVSSTDTLRAAVAPPTGPRSLSRSSRSDRSAIRSCPRAGAITRDRGEVRGSRERW